MGTFLTRRGKLETEISLVRALSKAIISWCRWKTDELTRLLMNSFRSKTRWTMILEDKSNSDGHALGSQTDYSTNKP